MARTKAEKPYTFVRPAKGAAIFGTRWAKTGKPQATLREAVLHGIELAEASSPICLYYRGEHVRGVSFARWGGSSGVRVELPEDMLRLLMTGKQMTDEQEQAYLRATAALRGSVRR